MNKNADLLKEIGLSDHEADTYLLLQRYDALTVTQLARYSDIHRVSLYGVLEQLVQKGLVSSYKKGGKTFFSALDPKHLLTYLDREKDEQVVRLSKLRKNVEELLPSLQSNLRRNTTKPKVQFYEGEKGMREAYEDSLTAKEPIVAYANVQTMHEGLPHFFPQYYARRAGAKVGIRAILPVNELSVERAKHDQAELRQSRFLPVGVTFSPEVNIYNDKMLIASWQEKMAIIIQSKELADLQRVLFDQLWQQLPRHP